MSSCYVERRGKLASGSALEGAGKRAAFALFYGPQHFLVTRHIVEALPGALSDLRSILDLGCGSGVAGAAWALGAGGPLITGVDRHSWAVREARQTYRALHLRGRAVQGDVTRTRLPRGRASGILAAYAINELPEAARSTLLASVVRAHQQGARVLIVEPIARGITPWWPAWRTAFERAGGRADEWRVRSTLPQVTARLGRAAGLDPGELTARSLFLG